ncbi:hypothetical protein FB45DRAFT_1130070 [Roridomyces roridus]|uniref:Uncharacterized protein n=1 Tax=Roridomyces roridus TaxID=1738132 RepID=A0AAD7B2V2_9AGAR|nr:hypothetical protein FB45DRAFT_1130070 [Roridomyces roridus]
MSLSWQFVGSHQSGEAVAGSSGFESTVCEWLEFFNIEETVSPKCAGLLGDGKQNGNKNRFFEGNSFQTEKVGALSPRHQTAAISSTNPRVTRTRTRGYGYTATTGTAAAISWAEDADTVAADEALLFPDPSREVWAGHIKGYFPKWKFLPGIPVRGREPIVPSALHHYTPFALICRGTITSGRQLWKSEIVSDVSASLSASTNSRVLDIPGRATGEGNLRPRQHSNRARRHSKKRLHLAAPSRQTAYTSPCTRDNGKAAEAMADVMVAPCLLCLVCGSVHPFQRSPGSIVQVRRTLLMERELVERNAASPRPRSSARGDVGQIARRGGNGRYTTRRGGRHVNMEARDMHTPSMSGAASSERLHGWLWKHPVRQMESVLGVNGGFMSPAAKEESASRRTFHSAHPNDIRYSCPQIPPKNHKILRSSGLGRVGKGRSQLEAKGQGSGVESSWWSCENELSALNQAILWGEPNPNTRNITGLKNAQEHVVAKATKERGLRWGQFALYRSPAMENNCGGHNHYGLALQHLVRHDPYRGLAHALQRSRRRIWPSSYATYGLAAWGAVRGGQPWIFLVGSTEHPDQLSLILSHPPTLTPDLLLWAIASAWQSESGGVETRGKAQGIVAARQSAISASESSVGSLKCPSQQVPSGGSSQWESNLDRLTEGHAKIDGSLGLADEYSRILTFPKPDIHIRANSTATAIHEYKYSVFVNTQPRIFVTFAIRATPYTQRQRKLRVTGDSKAATGPVSRLESQE